MPAPLPLARATPLLPGVPLPRVRPVRRRDPPRSRAAASPLFCQPLQRPECAGCTRCKRWAQPKRRASLRRSGAATIHSAARSWLRGQHRVVVVSLQLGRTGQPKPRTRCEAEEKPLWAGQKGDVSTLGGTKLVPSWAMPAFLHALQDSSPSAVPSVPICRWPHTGASLPQTLTVGLSWLPPPRGRLRVG